MTFCAMMVVKVLVKGVAVSHSCVMVLLHVVHAYSWFFPPQVILLCLKMVDF